MTNIELEACRAIIGINKSLATICELMKKQREDIYSETLEASIKVIHQNTYVSATSGCVSFTECDKNSVEDMFRAKMKEEGLL